MGIYYVWKTYRKNLTINYGPLGRRRGRNSNPTAQTWTPKNYGTHVRIMTTVKRCINVINEEEKANELNNFFCCFDLRDACLSQTLEQSPSTSMLWRDYFHTSAPGRPPDLMASLGAYWSPAAVNWQKPGAPSFRNPKTPSCCINLVDYEMLREN